MLPAEDDAGTCVFAEDDETLLEDSGSVPGMTLELDELGLTEELDMPLTVELEDPGLTAELDEFGLSEATDDDEGACVFAEDDETLLEDSVSVPGMTLELDELGLTEELDAPLTVELEDPGLTAELDEFGLSETTDDDDGVCDSTEDDETLLEDSVSVPGMTGELELSEHDAQASAIDTAAADFSSTDVLNKLKFIFKPYKFFS